MRKYATALLTTLFSLAATLTATASAGDSVPAARHVILIIGDGMDEQQVTIARNYLKGAGGELLLDSMPLRGASQILTITDSENGKPVYVADSANTATSIATGVITSRGRIATAAGSDAPLTTIAEMAAEAGFRTGLVTTSSVTDATPSAFAAHINFRLCENPELMDVVEYRGIELGSCRQFLKANGGGGSIAEQLAASPLDVILGGGAKHFEPNAEGSDRSVARLARDNGFRVLYDAGELASAAPGERLLGLFSGSTMPVRLQGENGRLAEEPETSLLHSLHRYLGEVTLPSPMRCEPNPEHAGLPSLKEMTDVALAQLSHDNSKGFFLMIESASIDKQAHERKPCGSIGEMEQLEEALASALAFADDHPDTLVIVTADHSQAAQIIPDQSLFSAYPIPTYTPGKLARIVTPEGSVMSINYATTNFMMEEHTGAAVPLYGNAQALDIVPPFVRQPELFAIMRDYLGL